VECFSLEDLRKGALAAQEAGEEATRTRVGTTAQSALYGEEVEDRAQVEGQIYFPYVMSPQERP